MKRLLLIPLVLFVSCEDNTPNNYTIDASFRYPSEEGIYWEYSCFYSIDTSMMEGISIVRIIDNNSIPDSCGDNVTTLISTDSIISNTRPQLNIIIDDSEWYGFNPPEITEISSMSDTSYYSHSGSEFSFCERRGYTLFSTKSPPNLQYPLTVGSMWSNNNPLTVQYEIIGEETLPIYLKNGSLVYMECLVITYNISNLTVYYYLSSVGLVKSSLILESIQGTNYYPDGTGETITSSFECTLIDYYLP